MKSALRILALIVLATAAFGSDKTKIAVPRYTQTEEERADVSLTLTLELGGFPEEKRVFFYRVVDADDTSYMSSSINSNACGPGVGFGLSTTAIPEDKAVRVTIDAYWTSESATGESRLKFSVPYMEAKQGKEGGFTYSAQWKKFKK